MNEQTLRVVVLIFALKFLDLLVVVRYSVVVHIVASVERLPKA